MEQKEKQMALISHENMETARENINEVYRKLLSYGIEEKIRGWDIRLSTGGNDMPVYTAYAYFKYLTRVNDNIASLCENALLSIADAQGTGFIEFYDVLFLVQKKVKERFDIGPWYHEEILSKGKTMTWEIQEKLEHISGFRFSISNLVNTLKSQGFTDEMIDANLAPFIVPVRKTQEKLFAPVIFNNLNVNENYTLRLSDEYYIHENGSVAIDFKSLLEEYLYNHIATEQLRIVFDNIKKKAKNSDEKSNYRIEEKIIHSYEIANGGFGFINNSKVFLLDHLFHNMNIGPDLFKEFYNTRKRDADSVKSTYITSEFKLQPSFD